MANILMLARDSLTSLVSRMATSTGWEEGWTRCLTTRMRRMYLPMPR